MTSGNVRTIVSLLIAWAIFITHAAADPPGAIGPDPKTVSVLYLGRADSLRMKQTQAFLEKHFVKVEACNLKSDYSDTLSNCDVVVLDWDSDLATATWRELKKQTPMESWRRHSLIHRARFDYPRGKFTNTLAKPVVVMGIAGLLVANLQRVDCEASHMGDYARDSDMQHPIFKGPLPVDIKMEAIEKPINYFLHSGTSTIGEIIQGWRIQKRTELDPLFGLCCESSYLTDTPNAELISGGTADAPDSATIFYGNYFVWGFACTPENMTHAGQAAFVNSICYMKAYSGEAGRPVQKEVDLRRRFVESLYFFRSASDVYTAANQKYMEEFGASALDKYDYSRTIQDPAVEAKTVQQHRQEQVASSVKSLPRDVRDQFPDDPLEIIDYYEKNIEYLHPDAKGRFVVDEEVQTLGISNRSPEFLKKCIELLGSSKDSATAIILLQRYTGDSPKTPEQWRQWYEAEGKAWVFDENQSRFVASNK